MLTDGTPSASSLRASLVHGTAGIPCVVGWVRREFVLTWRTIADNLLVSVLPTALFAIAAGIHYGRPGGAILAGVGKAAVLGLLFVYTNDFPNQARAGVEDALNKPYRPIPAGLATPAGLMRRFWLITPIYFLLGWSFGVWQWVLLWQLVVVVQVRWWTPRYYLWWKPVFNFLGEIASFAAGWQILAPLDATGWTWILGVSIYFTLAMIYEDVRDMAGDRAVGRRTLALVIGSTFVRRWFATFMILLPGVFYFALVRASGAEDWRGLMSAAVLAIVSWACALRALLWHGRSADRLTYQLFCLVWALTIATAPLLLAHV